MVAQSSTCTVLYPSIETRDSRLELASVVERTGLDWTGPWNRTQTERPQLPQPHAHTPSPSHLRSSTIEHRASNSDSATCIGLNRKLTAVFPGHSPCPLPTSYASISPRLEETGDGGRAAHPLPPVPPTPPPTPPPPLPPSTTRTARHPLRFRCAWGRQGVPEHCKRPPPPPNSVPFSTLPGPD